MWDLHVERRGCFGFLERRKSGTQQIYDLACMDTRMKVGGQEQEIWLHLAFRSYYKNPQTSEAGSFLSSQFNNPIKARSNMLCQSYSPLMRNASDMQATHQGSLDVMGDDDNLSNPIKKIYFWLLLCGIDTIGSTRTQGKQFSFVGCAFCELRRDPSLQRIYISYASQSNGESRDSLGDGFN